MRAVAIPITKENGRIKVLQPEIMRRVVDSLKNQRVYTLTIRDKKEEARTVSDPMRRYYWAVVVAMIAEETGHSKEMIHEALKRKILAYTDDRTGLEMVPSVFSDQSTLTIQEKKAFIEEVRRWAFDFLNLSIPDPQTVIF
jgi:hypothetical protein